MSEWISLEVGLPDYGVRVLFVSNTDPYRNPVHIGTRDSTNKRGERYLTDYGVLAFPTHWMILPDTGEI